MSGSITEAMVEDFEALVHHLGQQKMSRLRSSVRNRTGTGDIYSFERLAASEMADKFSGGSGRAGATPVQNIAHTRRRCAVSTFQWGEIVDNSDVVRILIDPDSEYLAAATKAYGRKIDDIITAAVPAATLTGSLQQGTGGTQNLPAAQKIGAGTLPMSLDYLRQAKRKLDEAEVGDEDGGERYCAINAKGLEDMLKITEVTSSDYNSVKALVNGEIDTYLGFKFIRTERIIAAGAYGSTTIVGDGCYCWERSSLALSISDDKFTRVGEDPSTLFSTRIYCELTMGAVRVEDEGVVVIDIAS